MGHRLPSPGASRGRKVSTPHLGTPCSLLRYSRNGEADPSVSLDERYLSDGMIWGSRTVIYLVCAVRQTLPLVRTLRDRKSLGAGVRRWDHGAAAGIRRAARSWFLRHNNAAWFSRARAFLHLFPFFFRQVSVEVQMARALVFFWRWTHKRHRPPQEMKSYGG